MKVLMFTSAVWMVCAGASGDSIAPTTAPATAPANNLTVVELKIQPAALPIPALRYQLVPNFAERTPGDAAPLYLMAMLLGTGPDDTRLSEMLAAPDDKFSVAAAKELLQSRQSSMELIDLAARREHCDFQLPIREKTFATLLPHLSHLRNFARLLSLQARVQIAEGKFDDALHTLQTGFGMVVQLKNDAVLIQGLVAVAMTNILLDRVAQWEQTAGGPNLYWGLADLPRPMVDLRAMMDFERSWIWYVIPDLKGRSVAQISDAEFAAMALRFRRLISFGTVQGKSEIGQQLSSILDSAAALPAATRWLQSHGHSAEQLNAMSPQRIVGIYYLESYQVISDELYTCFDLPVPQQQAALEKADKLLKQGPGTAEFNPLLALLPALSRVSSRVGDMDRRLAMMQTVEALRGYAASHDGKLPTALADLTETLAPLDPSTEKSFEYELAGAIATLRTTAAKGHEDSAAVYRVRLPR